MRELFLIPLTVHLVCADRKVSMETINILLKENLIDE